MTRVATTAYDAIVVGSGPNGLAAAITLQESGLSVLLIEGKDTIGGGMRTLELTLPGYRHDICSAVHPMALMSPFFERLPLADFGLKFVQPTHDAAHPLDGGRVAVLDKSVEATARQLGADGAMYRKWMGGLLESIPKLLPDLLGPLQWPDEPFRLAAFGLNALPPATWMARKFKTAEGRALWAGMAAHSIQPLGNIATSAFGIMLMAAAHVKGWVIPVGGSQRIADALAAYFQSLGGKIQTGWMVGSVDELPSAKVFLMDVTPKQIVRIAGDRLSSSYKRRLEGYRQGPGVFKVDWALDEPIPFQREECRGAGTVHLGNTFEEIVRYERNVGNGKRGEKPFALVAQQSLFDNTRAPEGKHTAWAYCHVPNGDDRDMTDALESQIERYAPGFRDIIKAKHTTNASALEQYNPNYIGGDINGGIQDVWQLYSRPVLSITPYRTSAKDIYICSSSTPPGGGVHGMCGYHAARQALKDVFRIEVKKAQ
ncbi:Phytoene dehydrogenase-related protein [Dyadobacter soli]|uniref:Pyridine nucleotide-disulfide oxidoreductase domain-containing protein 2 n=1 Tax=Dyadobacter soli TaxID=659014 RepID=A0A1G7XST3_9BACT|nr:Phytoene dehydrogenase-related protein [Dyadobacter soli]